MPIKLILVKHARPEVNPLVSSEQWSLGAEGRRSCVALAEAIRPHRPAEIVSSVEPKAEQTAQILSVQLGVPYRTAENLHEHDRSNVPHLDTREFISLMEVLFRDPSHLALGLETAVDALSRFEAAVDGIVQKSAGNIAVVSHGTVIALLAQARAGREPFALWRAMAQPSFLVFELPGWKLLEERSRI